MDEGRVASTTRLQGVASDNTVVAAPRPEVVPREDASAPHDWQARGVAATRILGGAATRDDPASPTRGRCARTLGVVATLRLRRPPQELSLSTPGPGDVHRTLRGGHRPRVAGLPALRALHRAALPRVGPPRARGRGVLQPRRRPPDPRRPGRARRVLRRRLLRTGPAFRKNGRPRWRRDGLAGVQTTFERAGPHVRKTRGRARVGRGPRTSHLDAALAETQAAARGRVTRRPGAARVLGRPGPLLAGVPRRRRSLRATVSADFLRAATRRVPRGSSEAGSRRRRGWIIPRPGSRRRRGRIDARFCLSLRRSTAGFVFAKANTRRINVVSGAGTSWASRGSCASPESGTR